MRGATLRSSPALQFNEVSIHAPHARGDNQQLGKAVDARCFNPRPSCEGRPGTLCTMSLVSMFQSTPLMRGATCGYRRCGQWLACFNPRPSCEGRPVKTTKGFTLIQFQSTPLMRGATRDANLAKSASEVSIHAPHARGDFTSTRSSSFQRCFNPRPSCEGRPCALPLPCNSMRFQSTPLMRGATTSSSGRR